MAIERFDKRSDRKASKQVREEERDCPRNNDSKYYSRGDAEFLSSEDIHIENQYRRFREA
jgi:hypothetical protein